jgi:hypothetical protein
VVGLAFLLQEEADTLLLIDVVRWEEATTALKEKIAAQGEIIYDRETKPEPG